MGWREWTDRLYWQMQPAFAPDLRNSQHEYAEVLKKELPRARRWLDLGCGHDFLPPWMDPEERALNLGTCRAVGIDGDLSALVRHRGLSDRILGNIEHLPFADNTFDLVTANMVVEHVAQPESLFKEVQRILAPGGRLVLHTPNSCGYTTLLTRTIPGRHRAALAGLLLARAQNDVYPTYYRANTCERLEELAREAQLRVNDIRPVRSSPQMIAIPPLLLLEFGWSRLLRYESFARLRPCLLATFFKPEAGRLSHDAQSAACP